MKPYIVVRRYSHDEIVHAVCEYIEKGYQPIGGIAYQYHEANPDDEWSQPEERYAHKNICLAHIFLSGLVALSVLNNYEQIQQTRARAFHSRVYQQS